MSNYLLLIKNYIILVLSKTDLNSMTMNQNAFFHSDNFKNIQMNMIDKKFVKYRDNLKFF